MLVIAQRENAADQTQRDHRFGEENAAVVPGQGAEGVAERDQQTALPGSTELDQEKVEQHDGGGGDRRLDQRHERPRIMKERRAHRDQGKDQK